MYACVYIYIYIYVCMLIDLAFKYSFYANLISFIYFCHYLYKFCFTIFTMCVSNIVWVKKLMFSAICICCQVIKKVYNLETLSKQRP